MSVTGASKTRPSGCIRIRFTVSAGTTSVIFTGWLSALAEIDSVCLLTRSTAPARPIISVTQMIGRAGAVLRVSKHTLSISARALSHPVKITLVVPADTVNRIRMQPEGLVFDAPVTLTMSYVNCDTGSSTDPKQIAYTDDSLRILEYEPSVDDLHGRKVTGQLTHFSQYAVGW